MSAGVKGGAADLRNGRLVWAGAEALGLTPGLPLAVCACLDDPQWAAALALPPSAADARDAERYPPDGRRIRFLQRRGVLRTLASRTLGCAAADVAVSHDAQGAPCVIAPAGRLYVSVAGRGALAAFALAAQPVGVDLEPLGAPLEPAWNILHASERAWLNGLSDAARHAAFLKIWTVKEACLKMLGLGLRLEPAAVAVSVGADGAAVVICAETVQRNQLPQVASPSRLWGRALARDRGGGRRVLAVKASPRFPTSTSRNGGQPQTPQRPAFDSETPCFAEWRQLTLGGEAVFVAVTASSAQPCARADSAAPGLSPAPPACVSAHTAPPPRHAGRPPPQNQ